jgi:hypothetical protein
MRSFFEIYDLIVLLIAALSESHGDDRERLNADLARLARTCKATRDPALDILWKTIMGFVPILELFPLEFHTNALVRSGILTGQCLTLSHTNLLNRTAHISVQQTGTTFASIQYESGVYS